MPVPFTSIDKIGSNNWTYTWDPNTTTSPYRPYLRGELLVNESTTATEYTVSGTDLLEPPPLEVLDATDTVAAQNLRYSPLLTLQWRGDTDAGIYRVEEKVSSVWTLRRTVQETGAGYYRYESATLADITTHNFRIIPVDPLGVLGNPLPVDVFMVRNPAVPSISLSYSSGTGDVTVSAR